MTDEENLLTLSSTDLSNNNNNSRKSFPVTSKEGFQVSGSPELKARKRSSRRKECPGCGQVSLCHSQVCCERCVMAQKQLLSLARKTIKERVKPNPTPST